MRFGIHASFYAKFGANGVNIVKNALSAAQQVLNAQGNPVQLSLDLQTPYDPVNSSPVIYNYHSVSGVYMLSYDYVTPGVNANLDDKLAETSTTYRGGTRDNNTIEPVITGGTIVFNRAIDIIPNNANLWFCTSFLTATGALLNTDFGSGQAIYLYDVVFHEVSHALGLGHSLVACTNPAIQNCNANDQNQIMNWRGTQGQRPIYINNAANRGFKALLDQANYSRTKVWRNDNVKSYVPPYGLGTLAAALPSLLSNEVNTITLAAYGGRYSPHQLYTPTTMYIDPAIAPAPTASLLNGTGRDYGKFTHSITSANYNGQNIAFRWGFRDSKRMVTQGEGTSDLYSFPLQETSVVPTQRNQRNCGGVSYSRTFGTIQTANQFQIMAADSFYNGAEFFPMVVSLATNAGCYLPQSPLLTPGNPLVVGLPQSPPITPENPTATRVYTYRINVNNLGGSFDNTIGGQPGIYYKAGATGIRSVNFYRSSNCYLNQTGACHKVEFTAKTPINLPAGTRTSVSVMVTSPGLPLTQIATYDFHTSILADKWFDGAFTFMNTIVNASFHLEIAYYNSNGNQILTSIPVLAATLPLGCDGINDREMQPTEEIQASDFAIYPNPTNDKFTVGFAKPFSGEIMVYNLQGIQLMKYTVKDALQTDISLQNTAAGMYIVQLQGIDGSKQIGKIVKVE